MRRLVVLTALVVLVAVPASGQEYGFPTPTPAAVTPTPTATPEYLVPTPTPSPTPSPAPVKCKKTKKVVRVRFDRKVFVNLRKHYRVAIERGWPKVLVLNRKGAAARTKKVLARIETRAGYDRDEYPPAIGRGKGKGLRQGRRPRGWVADVGYVLSPVGVMANLTIAAKLAPYCGGTRFRYAWS